MGGPLPAQPLVRPVQAGRPADDPAPGRHRHPARLEPDQHAAHPGFTRTNLQTAGASLGRDKPQRTIYNSLHILPSQGVETGTEPLLYAATSPGAVNGGYYGPGAWFGLVGPTTTVRIPRSARDDATAAPRLWAGAGQPAGSAPSLPAAAAQA